ncbi:MAG: hypothetical protein E6767_16270 [Dysgonomonas sp.]|nr:hypothetical protein [Dysgonomonas sp.]
MKANLIIVNWLLSFLMLAYNGNSLILTFIVGLYFILSCSLTLREWKCVYRQLYKLNRLLE